MSEAKSHVQLTAKEKRGDMWVQWKRAWKDEIEGMASGEAQASVTLGMSHTPEVIVRVGNSNIGSYVRTEISSTVTINCQQTPDQIELARDVAKELANLNLLEWMGDMRERVNEYVRDYASRRPK